MDMWFQQDGATSHAANVTINLLEIKFGERVISRNGLDGWPPRSCHLTPLGYFLWGYVNSMVNANKPVAIDELCTNIEREAVSANLCLKIVKNWGNEEFYRYPKPFLFNLKKTFVALFLKNITLSN